jgi:hypothetical protein
MDENTKAVAIVAIGALVTVATTYIAARWHVSRGLQPGKRTLGCNAVEPKVDGVPKDQGKM